MTNLTRVEQLEAQLKSFNYNENGMPIGVDADVYIAIIEELDMYEAN